MISGGQVIRSGVAPVSAFEGALVLNSSGLRKSIGYSHRHLKLYSSLYKMLHILCISSPSTFHFLLLTFSNHRYTVGEHAASSFFQ